MKTTLSLLFITAIALVLSDNQASKYKLEACKLEAPKFANTPKEIETQIEYCKHFDLHVDYVAQFRN
jgi:hypothetical protein